MRRRAGSLLMVLGTVLVAATVMGSTMSGAAEPVVYADGFVDRGYGGGTGSWNGPWREAPVHNGSQNGNITIINDAPGCGTGCLSVGDPVLLVDPTIARSADTSEATALTLEITYRIDGNPLDAAIVTLSVSDGVGWQAVRTFPLSASQQSMRTESFDVSGVIGEATTIRFSLVGVGLEGSALLVDRVGLTLTTEEAATTTTSTTTTPPSTTTTTSTTTTAAPTTTTTTTIAPTTSQPSTTTTTTSTTTTPPPPDLGGGKVGAASPAPDDGSATDKSELVSSSETAATDVMMAMDEMAARNTPDPFYVIGFVNAAEAVRSTAVYGIGIGLILGGFLLVGFDTEARRKEEKTQPGGRPKKGEAPRNLGRSLGP